MYFDSLILTECDVEVVMKEYTGAGQTIVVIDNGYNDQYRTNDIIYEYDFADGDESSFFHRSNHGSQVSQIVGKTAIDADIINLTFVCRSVQAP